MRAGTGANAVFAALRPTGGLSIKSAAICLKTGLRTGFS